MKIEKMDLIDFDHKYKLIVKNFVNCFWSSGLKYFKIRDIRRIYDIYPKDKSATQLLQQKLHLYEGRGYLRKFPNYWKIIKPIDVI